MIVREEAPCIAGATVSCSTWKDAPVTPASTCVDHASDDLPSETLACGASKLSPKIMFDEKPRTWCVKPESEWQPMKSGLSVCVAGASVATVSERDSMALNSVPTSETRLGVS